LTREYTEIHSGEAVKLLGEHQGKVLLPQTLSSVIWRHYLHPEDKSFSPDGESCDTYTRGLLLRRPIQAMTPLVFIGKEIERKVQEGEDVSVLENTGPIQYQRPQTAKTRAADAGLILRARRFPLRQLMRESGASQHAIERFLDGDRIHLPAFCPCKCGGEAGARAVASYLKSNRGKIRRRGTGFNCRPLNVRVTVN